MGENITVRRNANKKTVNKDRQNGKMTYWFNMFESVIEWYTIPNINTFSLYIYIIFTAIAHNSSSIVFHEGQRIDGVAC